MKIEYMVLDLYALNRVLETQDVSKKYSFEIVRTNYIVGQLGLMANFGLVLA